MKRQTSYREFTSHFLNGLKSQRDNLFKVINTTEGEKPVRDMLIQLLNTNVVIYHHYQCYYNESLIRNNPNGINYASFIQDNSTFRTSFRKIRMIDQEISQTSFENAIEEIKQELDDKFEKNAEKAQDFTMLISMIKEMVNNEQQKPASSLIKVPIPAREAEPLEIDNRINSSKDLFKKNGLKQQVEKGQSSKSIKQLPKPKIESPVVNKVQEKLEKVNGRVIQIDYNKLEVEVRYLSTLVDLQDYSYNRVKLKDSLNNYVKKYLKENSISVLSKAPQVRIMDDTSYIKSKQAGNYRFNPFCDAVQIFIKMKQKLLLDYNFKVSGNVDQIRIVYKKFQPKDWNKNMINLGPKSSILNLVQYICNKRQASQFIEPLAKALSDLGGANTVQDLYGWERHDYSTLHIMPTFIFEIQELIEQIKDMSQVGNGQKSLNDRKKQCIKIANSHKILRYTVYSTQGPEGVKNIAWLNMQNLKNAIKIVREQIYNEELLDQLDQYFNQFALNPDNEPISFSRGLVLYGPPGTGKTVLTEALPNIIGFHLIEKGLSAADFMKSLVGESSRMIRDLVNRAAVSPYLLCSVGIDEVDGLVPDRKDKDEKNKGEGISMLLSVIGGNKDVSNLVFMTSTNYLKKIDEAIRRRLSGQYQVGRPNPWARTQIILGKLDYLKGKNNLLDHLIKITTNFTGAAIGSLANFLLKSLKIKTMNGKSVQLSIDETTEAAILIARQFSIKLGVYTLPEIYSSKQDKKFMFSESFLEKISNHFMIVKYIKDNDYGIMYATETQRYSNGKVLPIYQKQQDKINIPVDRRDDFGSFLKYIQAIFPHKKYQVVCFRQSDHSNYPEYKRAVTNFLKQRQQTMKLKSKKTVLIVQDYKGYEGGIKFDAKLFERNHQNLYTFFYLLPHVVMSEFSAMAFGDWKSKQEQNKQNGHENYSGRIMVELNNQTRMAFELNGGIQSQSKVAFRLFLKSQESSSPKAVIPELVDFFTKQNVSYILLIDYELLLQNDAFEEKKVLEVMQEKMMQAKNYERVAVIINLDSMIMLNQNASDSNFGRSMSYSIQNYNLYQILLNYMRQFAIISGKTSRWMTVIAKHPQLIKIAKKHLDWPLYPEQIQKQREQQAKDEEKQCGRCGIVYNDRNNQEQRKCMQHPGKIIDTKTKIFDNSSPQELKAKKYKQRREKADDKDKKEEQDRYVYACCQKGLNEQGCQSFYHIEENQIGLAKDDLYEMQLKLNQRWNKVLAYFK